LHKFCQLQKAAHHTSSSGRWGLVLVVGLQMSELACPRQAHRCVKTPVINPERFRNRASRTP